MSAALKRRRTKVAGVANDNVTTGQPGHVQPTQYGGLNNSKRMSMRTAREVGDQLALLNMCRKGDHQCVYVFELRRGYGYIKIGTTVDLIKRAGDHQGNAYDELRLIAAFHGDRGLESKLHQRFWKHRVWGHREHFFRSKQVMRWVSDVVRLNGRDEQQCWSCRDEAIRTAQLNIPGLLEVGVAARKEDLRCGPKCYPKYFWFNATTGRAAHGLTSNGYPTEVPEETARALFHSANDNAWAINVWMAASNSNRNKTLQEGASLFAGELNAAHCGHDHSVWRDKSHRAFNRGITLTRADKAVMDAMPGLNLHHSARHVFPDNEHFPVDESLWDNRTNINAQVRNFQQAMTWLREDFLRRYGVVAVCDCDQFMVARNRQRLTNEQIVALLNGDSDTLPASQP